ncbi:MAG: hypothetical protein ABIA63_13580 [bacterium]
MRKPCIMENCIFRKAGLINIPWKSPITDDQIAQNKQRLFSLEYEAPFRFSLEVLITLPSASSNKKQGKNHVAKYSGVFQIKYLIGSNAFDKLVVFETRRLKEAIKRHDAVIAFQKDAYEAIRTKEPPPYNRNVVNEFGLYGETFYGKLLFCAPTTRVIRGKLDVLKHFREEIEGM